MIWFIRTKNTWTDPESGITGFAPDFDGRMEQERRVRGPNTLVKLRDMARITVLPDRSPEQDLLLRQILTHDYTEATHGTGNQQGDNRRQSRTGSGAALH